MRTPSQTIKVNNATTLVFDIDTRLYSYADLAQLAGLNATALGTGVSFVWTDPITHTVYAAETVLAGGSIGLKSGMAFTIA